MGKKGLHNTLLCGIFFSHLLQTYQAIRIFSHNNESKQGNSYYSSRARTAPRSQGSWSSLTSEERDARKAARQERWNNMTPPDEKAAKIAARQARIDAGETGHRHHHKRGAITE
jgi:hypothetical protein